MSDEKKSAPKAPEQATVKPALRYVGNGAALPDVPARDLWADEIAQYDRKALLASGLYEA